MLLEVAEEAKKEILKYCNNFEIYIERNDVIQIDSQKNSLNFAKEELNFGIGIRIINDDKLGFAYTSDINEINKVVEKAFLNSKLNEKDENFSFSKPSKLPRVNNIYDKKFDSLELEETTDFMKTTLDTVMDEKCEVASGRFSASKIETLILNSNEVNAFNKHTMFSGYISINAEKNGEKSTSYDSVYSCLFNLDPISLAKSTCKIAKDSIGGVKVETKDSNVIFDYHGASGLLNTFINSFNADNVQRGRSILGDKLDETIVSENLSIYDDGGFNGGLYSETCDSEGTPSQKTTLVQNGILKGFIHNIYTSNKSEIESNNKEGCEFYSTGNGMRDSYSSTPSVNSSNVIFDFKERIDISEIDEGLIITDVLGAHTANPISGDFSVEANNAFLIENGEIKDPVKKAMISGNIFKCLVNSNGIKSEIKQYGSFIIPKIFCENLRIIG